MTSSLNLAMTPCSVTPRNWILTKGYEFISFATNVGKNVRKEVSGRYTQKPLGHTK